MSLCRLHKVRGHLSTHVPRVSHTAVAAFTGVFGLAPRVSRALPVRWEISSRGHQCDACYSAWRDATAREWTDEAFISAETRSEALMPKSGEAFKLSLKVYDEGRPQT